MVRDFSVCDAGFFRNLNKNTDSWSRLAPVKSAENASWFKVADRNTRGSDQVALVGSPQVAGLPVLAYFDEHSDMGSLGDYYYWGFVVRGRLDDVVSKLKPLVNGNARLREVDGNWVRTEVKILKSPWLKVDSPNNAPGRARAERVFLIEREKQDTVRISCSLQGAISADILRDNRPDIDPADYPVQLLPGWFDKVQVPVEVVSAVAQARGDNTLWRPRFKHLQYTVHTKPANGNPYDVRIELKAASNGLVRVTESHNGGIMIRRLTLGAYLNLKTRIDSLVEGRVFLVKSLNLELPRSTDAGNHLRSSSTNALMPERPGELASDSQTRCEFGERFSASELHPALPGQAVALQCRVDSGPTEDKSFLEDLGVTMSATRQAQGGYATQVTDLELER